MQPPLTKGEQSRVTGVRLVLKFFNLYKQTAEELTEEGYDKKQATKSAIMRCVLEDYAQYAKVSFRKRHDKCQR